MKDKKNKPSQAIEISSLDQFQKLVDAPLICEFELDGHAVRVPLKRVTAGIEEQRRAIVRAVTPPYRETRKDYDPLDAKYLAAKELAEKQARSLVIYTCCPIVAAKKPGLTTKEDIHVFVSGLLSEQILDALALTAMTNGVNVEVQRRANFISPPGLES